MLDRFAAAERVTICTASAVHWVSKLFSKTVILVPHIKLREATMVVLGICGLMTKYTTS